jgi:integrase
MARPRTGQATYRRGRWVARILLHREPRTESGEYRTAQVEVTREGAPVTSKEPGAKSHAHRYAQRLQGLYDDGRWEPVRAANSPGAPDGSNSSKASKSSPEAPVTVGAWVVQWLATQSYSEAKRDAARVAVYLPPCELARVALGEVRPPHVARFVAELRASTSPKTGAPPAPRTVRNVYDVVRRALKSAVFEGLLLADPTTSLPKTARPHAEDAHPEARAGYRLGREEVEALVAASAGRWRVLWVLLALTGARLGEALALRWRDILEDTPLRRVVIARQVHHRTRMVTATKTREARTVPLHPELRRVLEVWRSVGWREEYGRAPLPEDLLLPARSDPGRPWGQASDAGGPLWAQDAYRALGRSLEAAGIRAHRVHDLRHTFASLCADAGMRENVAARWTHAPSGGSARHLYALPSWAAQCAEMVLLRVSFPEAEGVEEEALEGVSVPGSRTG